MTESSDNQDVMFYQLVLSLQASTMQHLGKVMSQVSGKIERNLEAARYSVDMLEMLQRKTANNLNDDEKKMLDHVLYQLRLNYVDEVNKSESEEPTEKPADEPPADSAETASEPPGSEESSANSDDSSTSDKES